MNTEKKEQRENKRVLREQKVIFLTSFSDLICVNFSADEAQKESWKAPSIAMMLWNEKPVTTITAIHRCL